MRYFLETERLIIKQAQPDDLDKWAALATDRASIHDAFGQESTPNKEEKLANYLERCIADYAKFHFAMGSVYSKGRGEFIGRAGLYYYFDHELKQDIELGCFLARKHWNKGYATELTKGMIDWGMENLPIERLTALTPVDLDNSHLVLEHSGMQRLERVKVENEDLFLYEITRKSWIKSDKQASEDRAGTNHGQPSPAKTQENILLGQFSRCDLLA